MIRQTPKVLYRLISMIARRQATHWHTIFMKLHEDQRHQDLVKSPGYWKTCFKFGKMAEKQPKSSEREEHLFPQFIVSLSGAMSFGLKCTMANLFKFFLCGFQRKPKGLHHGKHRHQPFHLLVCSWRHLSLTLSLPDYLHQCGSVLVNMFARRAIPVDVYFIISVPLVTFINTNGNVCWEEFLTLLIEASWIHSPSRI